MDEKNINPKQQQQQQQRQRRHWDDEEAHFYSATLFRHYSGCVCVEV